MTMMSNLPKDMAAEILSRVPVTSLRSMRSTCKKWNTFSKNHIIGKTTRNDQFLGLMLIGDKVCSSSFNLQGILKGDFVVRSIKQVRLQNAGGMHEIIHCDGLLLCVIKDKSDLVVWNPYLAQTWSIQARNHSDYIDMYALGYDKNRNHKILRVLDDFNNSSALRYEIYRFNSRSSWRVLDVEPDLHVWSHRRESVSLKGNTYFFYQGNRYWDEENEYGYEDEELQVTKEEDIFLLCFDFTTESFGPRLLLPFETYVGETVTVSCVRPEPLALLYQSSKAFDSVEIWVADKIDPQGLSWSKFLKVDIAPLTGFPGDFDARSFIIDEENKVAMVFDRYGSERYANAHIIGEDGYLKSVNIGKAPDLGNGQPHLFSYYVPSFVKLQINRRGKRKGRSYYTKTKMNRIR